ncbi:MAG TPA: hypothetical protein VMB02_13525 [Candidatus Aquilonibacter sp.]|nr:hypothetical protein [Candidatus Aquilonibacter sp.]
MALIGAGFTVVSALTWARDEFLSAETQEKWKIPKVVPRWHWSVWAAIGLVALLVAVLKSSYRVIHEHDKTARDREASLRAEADEEKRARLKLEEDQRASLWPQIHLECKWPHIPLVPAGGFPIRKRQILVKNLGSMVAVKVRFNVVKIGDYLADFGEVPKVENGHPVGVGALIWKEGSNKKEFQWDFEYLLHVSYTSHGQATITQTVPFRVEFEDVHGNEYESIHELVYNSLMVSGEIHFISFRRIRGRK